MERNVETYLKGRIGIIIFADIRKDIQEIPYSSGKTSETFLYHCTYGTMHSQSGLLRVYEIPQRLQFLLLQPVFFFPGGRFSAS